MLAAASSSTARAHPGFSLQQLLPPKLVVKLGSKAGRFYFTACRQAGGLHAVKAEAAHCCVSI